MRVCRFKVVAESQGIIQKPLVTSAYELPSVEFEDEWDGSCPSCGQDGVLGMSYCFNCGETL